MPRVFQQTAENQKASASNAILLRGVSSPRLSYRELGRCIQRRVGLALHPGLLLRTVGSQQPGVTIRLRGRGPDLLRPGHLCRRELLAPGRGMPQPVC